MARPHHPTPRPIQRSIKMGCTELCGCVHAAQRRTSTQIPIRFCVNLLVSVSGFYSVSGSVSGSVNALLMSGF